MMVNKADNVEYATARFLFNDMEAVGRYIEKGLGDDFFKQFNGLLIDADVIQRERVENCFAKMMTLELLEP